MRELAVYWPWDSLKGFLESPFTTSALGALFGAWLGAVAAQKIGRRDKSKDELLLLLRNINAAHVLVHNILNGAARLKEQHVQTLVKAYWEQRVAVHSHRWAILHGLKPPGVLHIQVEMNTLDVLRVRVDELQEAVLRKLPPKLRAAAVAAQLAETVGALNWSLAERNRIITEINRPEVPQQRLFERLFAVPQGDGGTDDVFGHLIEGLESSINATLYFTWRLSTDLMLWATLVRRQLIRLHGVRAERVFTIDFAEALAKGLIPPASSYPEWERLANEGLSRTYGRRGDKVLYIARREWRWFGRRLIAYRNFRSHG